MLATVSECSPEDAYGRLEPAVSQGLVTPGRGGYLHASPECWRAFARRRGPVRSLRVSPAPAERAALVAALAAAEAERGEG